MTNDVKLADKAVYRVVIQASLEAVWSTLVKTDEVLPFFFGSVCDTGGQAIAPGRPIRMVTPNGKFAAVVGEVLEFSPPHRYVHSFKMTHLDDVPCVVAYELEETPEGVVFTLTTTNVPAGTKTQKSMAQGGPFITDNLKALVETGKPAFSGRMVVMMAPLTGLMTPAQCRIENWPLEAGRYL
ncbi:MAG: hypothetical protein CME88_04115 [Hirschia sp.]|nr:hypothetical protein [Hirschia sp.]MBF17544.1 hypothetical protein [Hirschia sp.]